MKKEKLSNRKIKANETKIKIYKTANQLFKEYGFENVSVDSIVKTAKVSKGSFYVHFDSKDSLIAALIDDYVKKLDLNYKSYIESFCTETAVSDIFISLIGKIADILIDTIGHDHMKAVYKAQITKTVDADSVINYNRELYKIFSNIIRRGIKKGEFTTDIPADALSKHCIMSMRGLTFEWCIRYPDFDLKEQALMHFDILLKGIKSKNGT